MRVRLRGKRLYAAIALLLIIPFAVFRITGTLDRSYRTVQSAPAAHFTDAEAIHHIGTHATVTGIVADVHAATSSMAGPTFLDFGAPYPSETFTAVIFPRNRSRFGNLGDLEGKTVQVTGRIDRYRGRAEMILTSPDQLRTLN
jgi:DNA/RNA endonuclease YhcR with UshA esterase domain